MLLGSGVRCEKQSPEVPTTIESEQSRRFAVWDQVLGALWFLARPWLSAWSFWEVV